MRRRKKSSDAVQLNLAAMLDMAFQLLAFFILTFRPTPVEGQLALNLPPPVPVEIKQENSSSQSTSDAFKPEALNVFVHSNAAGEATQVRVGLNTIVNGALDDAGLQKLNQQLGLLFGEQGVLFDRIQISIDGRLHYNELMRIVDVCTQQKMPDGTNLNKISFIELGNTDTP